MSYELIPYNDLRKLVKTRGLKQPQTPTKKELVAILLEDDKKSAHATPQNNQPQEAIQESKAITLDSSVCRKLTFLVEKKEVPQSKNKGENAEKVALTQYVIDTLVFLELKKEEKRVKLVIKAKKYQNKIIKWLKSPNGSSGKAKKIGYIYVYAIEGKGDYYKVGCTERAPEERLREWSSKCGYRIQSKHTTAHAINFCEACERIIHYHLKDKGMWMGKCYCQKCDENHKEWFQGKLETILNIVKYWEKIMRLLYLESN